MYYYYFLNFFFSFSSIFKPLRVHFDCPFSASQSALKAGALLILNKAGFLHDQTGGAEAVGQAGFLLSSPYYLSMYHPGFSQPCR